MLEQILKKFRDEPVEFVRKILHAEPDEWQAEALNAPARRPRIAIRSGHGVGKTALESWAIRWFLFTRPFCKVPCTAPTRDQVNNILWSEISKWLKRSELLTELFEWQKTKICFRAQPERWAALAKSAARPENMAGFHEDHLLFVLDEASGIEDGIFEVIEGALTTSDAKLLICGNPTRNSGFFKRAFFEDRELYATFKVSSADSGRVANEYCKRLIKQYGADSDVVRVRVPGEFPKTEADGLIALELVEAATNREPVYSGELCIGVDVARFGNDETVIQPRIGNSALKFESYRRTDLMTTVGRIVAKTAELMKKFSLARATVNVDDDGVGGGVTDRLREVFTEKNLRVEVNGKSIGEPVKPFTQIIVFADIGNGFVEVTRGKVQKLSVTETNKDFYPDIEAADEAGELRHGQDNFYFTDGHTSSAILKDIKEQGGGEYFVRATSGKVEIIKRGENSTVWHFDIDDNLVKVSESFDASKVVTQVQVVAKSKDEGHPAIEQTVDGRTDYGTRKIIYERPSAESSGDAEKAALIRTLTEAILVHPAAEYVKNFSFELEGDNLRVTFDVKGRDLPEMNLTVVY